MNTQKTELEKLLTKLDEYTDREIENMYLLNKESMDRLNYISQKVQQKFKIKAQSLSLCKMIEIANAVIDGKGKHTETN